MDKDEMRMYEYGKLNAISEVNSLLEEINATSKPPARKLKQFTKRFQNKFKSYIPKFGDTQPTPFENKFCYLYTYSYRGYNIKVYDDDYGQQYYFYFDNQSHGCGAYNFDPEGYIRSVVDYKLDTIGTLASLDKKYAGAWLKYSNHEHTQISFTYRMEELKIWYSETGEFDLDAIMSEAKEMLDKLFANPEFQEYERQRKESGHLYFNEIMEQEEKKGN